MPLSLTARFCLAAHAGQHAAGILEKSLDLVVVEHRLSVLVAGKDGHALICHGIRAQSGHLVLDRGSIRALAGNEIPGDVLVGGPSAQNRLQEGDLDFQNFGFHADFSYILWFVQFKTHYLAYSRFPRASRTWIIS